MFRPRLAKIAGWLLVSVMLLAIGVLMVRSGQRIGWIVVLVFGLGVAGFGLQFLPNSTYLRLGPDGFTICTLFRRHSFRWTDVEAFEVRRVGTNQLVVFNFAPLRRGSPTLRARVAGADAAVATSGVWNISMEHLAGLLNGYRARYGAV